MTEREILDRQEQAGNREYYLVLVGSFLHAYGCGAFALARATGYRVMRKQRKWGEVLTTGFPISRLDQVRQQVRDAGGEVEQVDGKTWKFRGLDGTPDDQMVSDPRPKANPTPAAPLEGEGSGCAVQAAGYGWLVEEVRRFPLSQSTPMDAMMFIGTLQQQLNELTDIENDACESPAGHGLQE